jgi:RNA polymerase sigma factor (sigma-70 family)
MFSLISICFLFFFGISVICSRSPSLTIQQWKSIRYILQHPETTPEIRAKVKQILFHKYENLAIHRAYVFHKFHSHKCRNIRKDDLIISAKIGLFHCIRKYNGNKPFYPYLHTYIEGELYKGLTDFFPITAVSKKERKMNKDNMFSTDWKQRMYYRKKLNTHFLDFENFWQLDKMPSMQKKETLYDTKYADLEYLLQYQQWIRTLSLREQILIQMKYCRELKKIRSNQEIAEYMNVSEEAIRKALAKIRMKWWRTFLQGFSKKEYTIVSSSG